MKKMKMLLRKSLLTRRRKRTLESPLSSQPSNCQLLGNANLLMEKIISTTLVAEMIKIDMKRVLLLQNQANESR
jgi:hypothetical protein